MQMMNQSPGAQSSREEGERVETCQSLDDR